MIVLLQCIRSSIDRTFAAAVFTEVRKARNLLKSTKSTFVEARKYLAIIEGYIGVTPLMQQGVYRKGVCNFSHAPETHQSPGPIHKYPGKHCLDGNRFSLQTTQPSQNCSKRKKFPVHKQNIERRPSHCVAPPTRSSLNLLSINTTALSSSAQNPVPQISQTPPTGMLERATTESAGVFGHSNKKPPTPFFIESPSLDAMDSGLFWFDANCSPGSFMGELDSIV